MNKHEAEFEYWSNQYINKQFSNSWYEYFYTNVFDLTRLDYIDKKILDIGCGPMGSLEWISKDATCFGLDPLANLYFNNFECNKHKMSYISAFCEKIPFPDNYFDYVISMNSMDHVDDIDKSLLEIDRVIKKFGSFMVIVEINHEPTTCEPHSLSENFIEVIHDKTKLRCIKSKIYGIRYNDNLFKNIEDNIQDESNNKILLAKFSKIEC